MISECMSVSFCFGLLLGNKSRVNFTADKYFANILDPKTRARVTENAIQILKDVDSLQKNLLFERLINCYIYLKESPQRVLDLWDTMQEQNVIPTTGFIQKLHSYSEKHGTLIPLSFEEGMKSQTNSKGPSLVS